MFDNVFVVVRGRLPRRSGAGIQIPQTTNRALETSEHVGNDGRLSTGALGDGGRTDEAISDSIHANGRVGPTTDAVVRPAHPSSAVHAHPCHSRSPARPAVCRRSVGRPLVPTTESLREATAVKYFRPQRFAPPNDRCSRHRSHSTGVQSTRIPFQRVRQSPLTEQTSMGANLLWVGTWPVT